MDLIDQVQAVLDEYRKHWPLTIRQVFYRLVGRHGYPKDEAAYERLCNHMSNARRARVIPFAAVRDDGVVTLDVNHFADEDHFLRSWQAAAKGYRRDLLANQPMYVEVWCEAAGMMPQLGRVSTRFSVHVYSSSGFDSTTAKKDIADRICRIGKRAIVLHLGDFDPSGESIFQSAAEDVAAFVATDRLNGLVNVRFQRVALTAEQVEGYALPTAPAKATDSRSKTWAGATCQLEALAPDEIASLLENALLDVFDMEILEADKHSESLERARLTRRLLPAPGGQRDPR